MNNHPDYSDATKSFACRERNYKLCTAIDINSLHVVTNMMIECGADPKEIASLKHIAHYTLQLLRNINNSLEKE